jgi:drug/metabolite transporter (DMT)-like permease
VIVPGPRGGVVAASGAVLIWSTNALAGGAALERLAVSQVLALQFSGAFLLLGAARLAQRPPAASARTRPGPRTVVLGTVGITGTLGLQYVAFATAPLLAANAVAYAWPLIVAAWTARSPGARRVPVTLALALLGFAGVVLIFAQRGDDGAGSAPLLGCVAALGSALAMAWYTLAAGASREPRAICS